MKLFPAIVTLHLAGALVLLALLCVQVVRGGAPTRRLGMPSALRRWVVLGLCLAGAADFAGWLGQHQLRGAGLH